MLTVREAKTRAATVGGRIQFQGMTGEYRVTLDHWNRKQREAREYFTDCIEDALGTCLAMARNEGIVPR